MKILHISDLHFGKVIHGISMLENGDQPYWVDRFLDKAGEIRPDAVVIAGDVYDRSSPSGEAVTLLSRLLEGLEEMGVCVLLVAGNHDSGPRLAFARDILARQNIHIAGTVSKSMTSVTLQDEFGPVTFWLMPYVFPAAVAYALGDESIRDYETAVRRLIAEQPIDPQSRNVIIAHQNVTSGGSEVPRGGSESAVGGVGQVGHTAFDCFDYAALGHIHAAFPVGRETVRYSGSPLCYHFDETRQPAKGPILISMGEKGTAPVISTVSIPPLHPMREIAGTFEEVRELELARQTKGEYLKLVITDSLITPEISGFFHDLAESRGSVLMECKSECRLYSSEQPVQGTENVKEKSTEELFSLFYADRCGGEQPDAQDCELLRYAAELIRHSEGQDGRADKTDEKTVDALMEFLIKQEEKNRETR